MAFSKTALTALLTLHLCYTFTTAQQSSSVTAVRLFPTGRCDGPDNKPRVCFSQSDCKDCPGFNCAGCPGCPGTKFQGTCLGSNIAILCAQPVCDDCQLDQQCNSDNDCLGCGSDVKCRFCPVCPGQQKKGTCKKGPSICPEIGCLSCDKTSCKIDSDCRKCGSDYKCDRCPLCNGTVPASGTCRKGRFGLCPQLDCNCDKKGATCTRNEDCCESTEICNICPPCRNTKPSPGSCVSRTFQASSFSTRATSLTRFGFCPPCLPDFDLPNTVPIP